MKAIALLLLTPTGGDPDLAAAPALNYVQIGRVGGYGLYVLSGTDADLTAAETSLGAISFGRVTDDDNNGRYNELNTPVPAQVRADLQAWRDTHAPNLGTVPGGGNLRSLVNWLGRGLRGPAFDLLDYYVV